MMNTAYCRLLLIALIVTPLQLVGAGIFRVGVAKVNITPENSENLIGYAPRMSKGVRDSIYHKVVAFSKDDQLFILVSSDLGAIAPPTYHSAANRLKDKYKINDKDFWWTNTHTHSGPEVGSGGTIVLFLGDRYKNPFNEEYANFVEERLLKAVDQAINNLQPAIMGVGWGFSRANINRRARGVDDKTFLGENPDGPIDRKIGLIRIENLSGKPLALISNYPIHGTVLSGKDVRISGDVPGVVSTYVENKLGAPLLFINGALGNIAPRFSVSVNNSIDKERFLTQFNRLLGDKIIAANSRIEMGNESEISFLTKQIIIETPLKEDLDVEKWPANMSDYLRINSEKKGIIRMPINILIINDDIAIWSGPMELFCEISNEIRSQSPFIYTFYYGLTNGTLGYLPTEAEFKYGGYEPSVSPFSNRAGKDVIVNVTEALEYLNRHKSVSK